MRINIDSLTPIKVARHYDGAADVIEFDVGRWIEAYPALTEYRVEVTSPGGAVYFPEAVNLDGNMLKWTIMPSDTGTAGNGEYQIIATGSNGERKTSASARFVVREIMEGTAGETPPDPAQPWVEKVLDAAQKVEDATVHPPVIGENGNWWLWDFDAAAYVDSGKPSQGSGSGGGGIAQETDPTVPEWAKQPNPPTAPVQSVNGKTGDVKLNAADVGAASGEELARLNEEIVEQLDGKADQFTVGNGLQMDENRVLSAIGSDGGTPEELFSVTLAEITTRIVMQLKRPAKHMFVLVYPPENYDSRFLVYLSAKNCRNIELNKDDPYITDGTAVTQIANNSNRFMCKIDSDGGLISAYWVVTSWDYQSTTGLKFLNMPIVNSEPAGISTLVITSVVEGFEIPAGAMIRVIGV